LFNAHWGRVYLAESSPQFQTASMPNELRDVVIPRINLYSKPCGADFVLCEHFTSNIDYDVGVESLGLILIRYSVGVQGYETNSRVCICRPSKLRLPLRLNCRLRRIGFVRRCQSRAAGTIKHLDLPDYHFLVRLIFQGQNECLRESLFNCCGYICSIYS